MKIKLIAKIKDVIIGYVFDTDTNITIGREIGNTIAPIIDSISRHHAHIFFADGAWKVEDLGSTNGSLINGKKIEGQVALKSGDALRFGLIDMSVTFDVAAASAAPIPALEPVAELEPVSPLQPVAAAPVAPVPPKPVLTAGIKLPPRPGIKLPPRKP